MTTRIFIERVRKELAAECQEMKDSAKGDPLLQRFLDVFFFADRLEVWNPGELPPPLTPESLRKPHRSVLRNPRIAEVLFLAQYIEKYGTGTLMMIRESLDHALPEPSFGGNQPGVFGTTIWRDWLTEEVMAGLGLSERQRKIVAVVKAAGRIGNTEVQDLVGVSKRTAHRDLSHLVRTGLLMQEGTTGKGTFYALRKGATKGPEGSSVINQESAVKRTYRTSDARGSGPQKAKIEPHGPRQLVAETRHEPDKPDRERTTGGGKGQPAARGRKSGARVRKGTP